MRTIWLSRYRHALSSIASSTACEAECESLGGGAGGVVALRGARSLDALGAPRLRRQHTSRSLDAGADAAPDAAGGVVTVCRDPVFNGTIVGIVTEEAVALGPRTEASPLLREAGGVPARSRRKVHDASYIEFYKRCRSLENVSNASVGGGGNKERKLPRFAIPSWLLGFFGGAPRGSSASLRRAPPLLDTESAV